MPGSKKRKGAKAGRTNSKKQRQDDQTADEQKQIELPAVPQPPISRLYQDALQSVFKFCGLADLNHAILVSRFWSQAVRVMPCVRGIINCPLEELVPICSSALSVHIGSITLFALGPYRLISDQMYILALRMPQLTALECSITQAAANKVILPPRLQTLKVNLSKSDVAAVNTIIGGISQLTALVTLELTLPSFLPAVSFGALTAVASLRDLQLSSAVNGSQPSELHLDQLRSLPQLRKMATVGLSSQSLARLLCTPHELRWQEIHRTVHVDAIGSAALSSLPSLSTLKTWECTDISFLSHLVQLRTLDLHMAQDPWPATITADAVIDGLSVCAQLTDLELTAPLNNKQLSVVLPRLPLLTKLTLYFLSELESLAFLSSGPIVQQLRSLELYGCSNAALHTSELKHVYALKALEDLTLAYSFVESLTPLELFLHSPPTCVMPKLKTFSYTKP